MGILNRTKGTYSDDLTGTVSVHVGRKFHLSQMKRAEHGLKKVDDYYLESELEVIDVIKPSLSEKKKQHNANIVETFFKSNPPTATISLKSGGFTWIIELHNGFEKMLGISE